MSDIVLQLSVDADEWPSAAAAAAADNATSLDALLVI